MLSMEQKDAADEPMLKFKSWKTPSKKVILMTFILTVFLWCRFYTMYPLEAAHRSFEIYIFAQHSNLFNANSVTGYRQT